MLVGLLELGGELRAAVDLRDANGKGHAVRQGVHCLKTTPGSERTSRYRLEAGHRGGKPRTARFAHGMERKARREPATRVRGGSPSRPLAFHLGQDAAHPWKWKSGCALALQDAKLVLAPAGIAVAQSQDAIGQAGRLGGLAAAMRAVGNELLGW